MVSSMVECDKSSIRIGSRPGFHPPQKLGNTCEPWMSRHAISVLDILLSDEVEKGLEWSSGSSTLWLLNSRVKNLVSVEHDPHWTEHTKQVLQEAYSPEYLANRWESVVIPPRNISSTKRPADPASMSDAPQSENFLEFENYVTWPAKTIEPLSLDFISVDGRARVSCIVQALKLLKPHGGILVVDNTERSPDNTGLNTIPKHWKKFEDDNGVTKTTVFMSMIS
eukprot:jgi/Picre1/33427/NNA_008751.t1